VGARGYSGLELARLLLAHPAAKLTACFATDPSSFTLSNELYIEGAEAVPTLPMSALESDSLTRDFHTIFLATPAEVSLELAPKLVAKGVNVVDLSGAFRLDAADYPKWYGFEHGATAALASAQYGLVPFSGPFKKTARQGVLVSNPGCYVTSVLLALVPLAKAGAVDLSTVVIDAKSGTTGAGKKPSENLLFSEVDGECLPYKVGAHQHFPEIVKYLEAFSGAKASPFFSTSLLSTPRGIISGIYARLAKGKTEADVAGAFESAYSGYPLVKFGKFDKKTPKLVSLKQVVGTNRAQIAYAVDGDKLYVYSLIDNLLKGAASQAVENFNRLIDAPSHLGLIAGPTSGFAAKEAAAPSDAQ
jgi:N-acetyl-gamma-glutamyl-phosphate reductase